MTQLGFEWLTLDQLPQAEQILRRSLEKSPDQADTLLHLGRCLVAMDRAPEAQPLLERYQKLRTQTIRGPRLEPGMIELATISPDSERSGSSQGSPVRRKHIPAISNSACRSRNSSC